jgi:UDP-glucose:(glucosyl)LPS alpha-1,2-glucosyltransferase
VIVDTQNGRYVGAKGGSELMHDTLLQRLPAELSAPFQFIVSRVRDVQSGKRPILWCQDPWYDPEAGHLADPESRRRFRTIVFVAYYQFHSFHHRHGVPYADSVVLRNAIDPIGHGVQPKPSGTIRLIYHSVPNRGLDVLLPVFTALAARWPNLHLDVYSSFRLHGLDHIDARYAHLYDICRAHPQITYHGLVSNAEIREALTRAHIHAYPCTAFETCPVAVIESMSAGCLVVCPDVGGLEEIVSRCGLLYRWTERVDDHKIRFAAALTSAIEMIQQGAATRLRHEARHRIDGHYNWATRIGEWRQLLEGLLEEDRRHAYLRGVPPD